VSISITGKKGTLLDQKEVPADEHVQVVRGLLDQAGNIGRGPGMELIGYEVVFIYRGMFTKEGEFRCHSECKMVGEKSANDAFKALGLHMGKKYGRKLPGGIG
jgi:hypothetical protein